MIANAITKIKQYSLYIYASIATTILVVFYLLTSKNKTLENKNAELRSELDVKEDQVKLTEQKQIDAQATGDYQSIRDKYLAQSGHGDGSGEGEL